jgi:hypothetical protein
MKNQLSMKKIDLYVLQKSNRPVTAFAVHQYALLFESLAKEHSVVVKAIGRYSVHDNNVDIIVD